MQGRERKSSNDLFYVCSLIEYIARKSKNKPHIIVEKLGYDQIHKIYDLADIYHCENINKITYELIEKYDIQPGNYDTISECKYAVPTHWDIGKVYKRLVKNIADDTGDDVVKVLIEVFSSKIVDLIENYNSSFYYDNPGSIYATYQNNCIPE